MGSDGQRATSIDTLRCLSLNHELKRLGVYRVDDSAAKFLKLDAFSFLVCCRIERVKCYVYLSLAVLPTPCIFVLLYE